MANYFPLFMNLERAPVLIFGGGEKALKKAETLLPCGARVTVAAQTMADGLCRLAEEGRIRALSVRISEAENIILRERPRLVILADGEEEELRGLFALCRGHGIEVNTVDREEFCTVIFPSVITRKRLTVAVSTGGASPAAAKRIREDIEGALPTSVDDILDWLSETRRVLRERKDMEGADRSAFFRELVDTAFEADRPLTLSETERILAKYTQGY